ncbi:TPA: hypothetical protein HA338_02040 [Methanosarcina acetivorans]|uniref:Uncharacterized protein n=1 Tax=Methanosarcina acetivorans TaxID=2214 RepID=A0A832W8J9_9EURY|nr:hypothetical protein [Methanosarcina acetivorans]HIH92856.1 hypothetical protein [Methanosarcina acetivorans]
MSTGELKKIGEFRSSQYKPADRQSTVSHTAWGKWVISRKQVQISYLLSGLPGQFTQSIIPFRFSIILRQQYPRECRLEKG